MSATDSRPASGRYSRPASSRVQSSTGSRPISSKPSKEKVPSPVDVAKFFIDQVCQFWQERFLMNKETNVNYEKPVWVYHLQQINKPEDLEFLTMWETPCASHPVSLTSASVYWKFTVSLLTISFTGLTRVV